MMFQRYKGTYLLQWQMTKLSRGTFTTRAVLRLVLVALAVLLVSRQILRALRYHPILAAGDDDNDDGTTLQSPVSRPPVSWDSDSQKGKQTRFSSTNATTNDNRGFLQICSRLAVRENSGNHSIRTGSLLSSVGTLWIQKLSIIRQSLLHSPANEPFGSRSDQMKIMVDQLLDALPPSRLRRSVRPATHAARPDKIQRVLKILWQRYLDPQKNPPLQILVFGGSPVVGSNCERNARFKKQGHCAWPGHLQEFANAALGFDAVRVVNFGMGATSSQIATMMIQLRLFPPAMMPDGPDVIFNAYSVNDFSYHNGAAKDSGLSFGSLFGAFLEAVNGVASCERDRPLTVFLDDFSVNFLKDESVESVEDYRAEISKYTNYHQVLTVSYVDTVQDYLYGGDDEVEKLLIDWRGDAKHLPWGGHVAVVIVLAYNALQLTVDFCDQAMAELTTSSSSITGTTSASVSSTHRDSDANFRPPLDKSLRLNKMGMLSQQRHQHCVRNRHTETCPFAWIALRKENEHQHVQNVDDIIVDAENWTNVRKWPPTNFGFYGSRDGMAVLSVADKGNSGSNTTNNVPISTVTVIYMKSYSEKWYNSTVQATVHRCGQQLASVRLSGFHEKRTSEYFSETIELDPAPMSLSFLPTCYSTELTLQMVGGETFRIGGISFC